MGTKDLFYNHNTLYQQFKIKKCMEKKNNNKLFACVSTVIKVMYV